MPKSIRRPEALDPPSMHGRDSHSRELSSAPKTCYFQMACSLQLSGVGRIEVTRNGCNCYSLVTFYSNNSLFRASKHAESIVDLGNKIPSIVFVQTSSEFLIAQIAS
jgi:hypothetical protein